MAKLNDKQQKFVREYLIDYNATQAAIRSGYSKKTVHVQGPRLLANVRVQEAIEKLKAKDAQKLEVTRERIIAEYVKLAFGDIRKAFNEDGTLKDITDLDDDTAAMVAGLDVEKKGLMGAEVTKKVKLTDKRAALDSLCKVLGYNAPEKILTKMQLTDDEVIFE